MAGPLYQREYIWRGIDRPTTHDMFVRDVILDPSQVVDRRGLPPVARKMQSRKPIPKWIDSKFNIPRGNLTAQRKAPRVNKNYPQLRYDFRDLRNA